MPKLIRTIFPFRNLPATATVLRTQGSPNQTDRITERCLGCGHQRIYLFLRRRQADGVVPFGGRGHVDDTAGRGHADSGRGVWARRDWPVYVRTWRGAHSLAGNAGTTTRDGHALARSHCQCCSRLNANYD